MKPKAIVGLERSGFAVGTGRCGTKFIATLFEKEPHVAACHERHKFNDTFHRYCTWNKLPVDNEGFLRTKEKGIAADLAKYDFSFEASAYLSLSVRQLYRRIGSKIILLVRNPIEVVNSYYSGKDMYAIDYHVADINKAVGYHEMKPHFFLGRLVPRGEEFLKWRALSRIGKLGWMWNTVNMGVLEQFTEIPRKHTLVVHLEEFDYQKYQEIGRFLDVKLKMKERRFQRIAGARINKVRVKKRVVSDWSEKEIEDFLSQISPAMRLLGYEEAVAASLNGSLNGDGRVPAELAGQTGFAERERC